MAWRMPSPPAGCACSISTPITPQHQGVDDVRSCLRHGHHDDPAPAADPPHRCSNRCNERPKGTFSAWEAQPTNPDLQLVVGHRKNPAVSMGHPVTPQHETEPIAPRRGTARVTLSSHSTPSPLSKESSRDSTATPACRCRCLPSRGIHHKVNRSSCVSSAEARITSADCAFSRSRLTRHPFSSSTPCCLADPRGGF